MFVITPVYSWFSRTNRAWRL